jgi:hypothetical protein
VDVKTAAAEDEHLLVSSLGAPEEEDDIPTDETVPPDTSTTHPQWLVFCGGYVK